MKIGIPKENILKERRVGLAPAGVDSLVRSGHSVFVESGAGDGSHFIDDDYIKTGATIVYSAEEVYMRSEMIVKVAPVENNENELLQDNQILFSSLHLAVGKKSMIENMLKKNITAIGYELIENST